MTEIELVGNALCLDFANTVNARPIAERDWLGTADSAESWARLAGRPIRGEVAEIDAVLPDARGLRETVYRVFQPLAGGAAPPAQDVRALSDAYGDAAGHAELAAAEDGYRLSWPGPRSPRVLLWEVATSAVELLMQGPLGRLGECPSCGWLFLDTSRNGSRRWCSMTTCGSRDKAKRYYAARAVRSRP